MDYQDILNITAAVFTAIGGGAGLILILSKYFGDIWARSYLLNHKNELKKQFENEKRKIELEFEKSKNEYLRYSSQQFKLYNNLWIELVDVKVSADSLWNEASAENFIGFAESLKKAKTKTEKSKLFLEEDHYQNLMKLLKSFAEFRVGKRKLIELRFKDESNDPDEMVSRQLSDRFHVLKNEALKEKYENLLDDISSSFKEKLQHTAT